MKIILFGNKKISQKLLYILKKKIKITNIYTVNPSKSKKYQIADYYRFKSKEFKNVKINFSKTYDLKHSKDLNFFIKNNFDIGIVLGWQRIIPIEILNTFNIGVFGGHGSSMKLPRGRGRSPLNWSILEKRKYFICNLIKYSSGIDNGSIIDQKKFSINQYDTAKSLHYKNLLTLSELLLKNYNKIIKNKYNQVVQKEHLATYYPKRNPDDSLINWNNNMDDIIQLIKSSTLPFSGAFSFLKKKKIKIFSAVKFFDFKLDNFFKDFKNGQVCEIFSETDILIKVKNGVILINNFTIDGNIKIKKYDILNNNNKTIKVFKKNNNGYYDLKINK